MQKLKAEKLKENIEKSVWGDIHSGRVGGVALAVTQENETIYQGCFGDERLGISVTEDTVFRMASMTKPITAVAFLMLVDRGYLTLDTPVSKFIPAFSQMNIGRMNDDKIEVVSKALTQITPRHILTHSSGLGSGEVGNFLYFNDFPTCERKNLTQMMEYYTRNPLDFEPGTSTFYSAIHGFDVLARIAEIVTGMSFQDYLVKELFGPLGMKDTTFKPSQEQFDRMIPMHNFVNGMGVIEEMPSGCVFEDFPTTYFSGGGGLASTLRDYKQFAAILLNKGKGVHQILSEKLVREMATKQLPEDIMSGAEVWGLGVRVVVDTSYKYLPVGTFGWSGAYGTHFWVDPENQITAIYLKNSKYDGGCGETGLQFERNVHASF